MSTALAGDPTIDAGVRQPPRRALLAANAVALVLAYAIPRAFTLISTVVAARVLGRSVFGWYATAGAVAVVASIVATAGMQPLLVREVARNHLRAPRLLGAAHAAKVILVLLMALALLATPLLGFPREILLAAGLLGAGYAVGAFVENLAAYFQGVERMHVWTQASALQGAITGGAGAVLVLATHDLLWLCAAPVMGQTAALGWLLSSAPSAVRRPPLPAAADVAALLRQLAPFAATFVATTLFYRADLILLSHWRAPAEVGSYSAAYRFLDLIQALAIAGAGALLPHLSRRGRTRTGAARRLPWLVLLAATPLAVALFALRRPIVEMLYGPAYASTAPILGILAAAVVPLALNMFALAAFAAADAMREAAVLYAAAAALSMTLDLVWIPSHGAIGAAWVALLCESGLAIAFMIRMRRS